MQKKSFKCENERDNLQQNAAEYFGEFHTSLAVAWSDAAEGGGKAREEEMDAIFFLPPKRPTGHGGEKRGRVGNGGDGGRDKKERCSHHFFREKRIILV